MIARARATVIASALGALLGVLGLVVLVGCGGATRATGEPVTGSAASPSSSASATPSPTPTSSPTTSPPAHGPRPLPATKAVNVVGLQIPAIGVTAGQLEHLALMSNAELAAPKDPDLAGWYADGPVPGTVGPAVIAGHVDSTTGPAVFFRLSQLKAGAKIVVKLSDGTSATFAVDRLITTAKNHFPTDEVYGPTPDAQLRLITCGGPYDRTAGAYEDNTVVFATLVAK